MISKQQTIYLKVIAIIMVISSHIVGIICGMTNLLGEYGFSDAYVNNLLGTGGDVLSLSCLSMVHIYPIWRMGRAGAFGIKR